MQITIWQLDSHCSHDGYEGQPGDEPMGKRGSFACFTGFLPFVVPIDRRGRCAGGWLASCVLPKGGSTPKHGTVAKPGR